MNKRVVNNAIDFAYVAIKESGIEKNGHINKKYRSQISSFGAAITMGSLMPAIAFFSDNGATEVDRPKLMDAILRVLKKQEKCNSDVKYLFEYVSIEKKRGISESRIKEDIVNVSIAIKLAMNLYTFDE